MSNRAILVHLCGTMLLIAALSAPPTPARGEDRLGSAIRSGAEPMSYRPDAVLIRLTSASAARVREELAAASRRAGGERTGRTRPAGRMSQLGLPSLDRTAAELGVSFEREFPDEGPPAPGEIDFSRYWIVHLPPARAPEQALARLRAAAEVDAASAIAIVPVAVMPNDSLWGAAYYLWQPSRRDLHAPEAWDICRGDSSVPVAIIDTGVLAFHPDLEDRIWTNWAEAGGLPGVDDDGNGYVDDVRGWDFVNLADSSQACAGEDWRDEDNDPNDYAGHGTAVASLVGAVTDNGIGIAGALWDVRVMPLRVGWCPRAGPGDTDLSYAARAIRYATRAGVRVVNCSFLSLYQPDFDDAVRAAIHAGVTIVASAGNDGDDRPYYFGGRDDVVTVAATDRNDQLTQWSSYGEWVTVSAPGQNTSVIGVFRNPGADSVQRRVPVYSSTASGTSFSAPLTSGAVALMQAHRRHRGRPQMTPLEVKLRLMETADDVSGANPGRYGWGAGRINYARALGDPPTSFAAELSAITEGPAAVIGAAGGGSRFACATSDGRLLMFEGSDGRLAWSTALPAVPAGGVSAADLRGEGTLGLFVATRDGRIAGFDEAGRALPGWPVSATGVSKAESVEPALGDLDGDGGTEIVWGGNDGAVWAWDASGVLIPAFPRSVGAAGRNVMVALADLDGWPGLEIVAANSAGGVYALRADGSLLPGWPVATAPSPSSPVVATLGSDPLPCVIVGSGSTVYAFNRNGSPRWRSEVPLPWLVTGSPAVGDLDSDGYDEIAVMTFNTVVVLDSAGVRRVAIGVQSGSQRPEPIIGPFRDGRPALAAHVGGKLRVWDLGGAPVPGFPRPGGAGRLPSLADLDDDGRTEIVGGPDVDSVIYVFDAGPSSWNPRLRSWPTPRGNPARTGSRLHDYDRSTPPLLPLVDAQIGPDRVWLTWSAAGGHAITATLYRWTLAGGWESLDRVSADGAGLIAYEDTQVSAGTRYGYRLRVGVKGQEVFLEETWVDVPSRLTVASTRAEFNRVQLTWVAAGGHAVAATVYRRTATDEWRRLGQVSPNRMGLMAYEDRQVTAGSRYGYRLGVAAVVGGQQAFLGETWVDVPHTPEFALAGVRPNPAAQQFTVAFSLPDASPARLEVLDLAGRRIVTRDVGALGPGNHVVRVAGGRALAPGVYLVRLTRGSRSFVARGVFIR
jgi:subtilisin family serine protease